MSILLAAQKIQSDLAGLTGPRTREPTAAPTSSTEMLSYLHGESGSLGYLWDTLVVSPVTDALRAADVHGPNGGAGHPDQAGQRVLGPTFGAIPAGVPTPAPDYPTATVAPQPAADRVREALGAAQEQLRGLFGAE